MVVRIKKDNIEKTVTKGAYEEYYEHLGFKIVKTDDKKNNNVKDAKISQENFKKFDLGENKDEKLNKEQKLDKGE